MGSEPGGALQPLDNRIKRVVGAVWGAKIAHPSVRLGCDLLKNRDAKPAFANAWLARNENRLPFSFLGALPPPQQQLSPPDKRGPPARMQGFEPTLYRALAHDPQGADGLRQTLEVDQAQVTVFEEIPDRRCRPAPPLIFSRAGK
jgi:hypothetical protein